MRLLYSLQLAYTAVLLFELCLLDIYCNMFFNLVFLVHGFTTERTCQLSFSTVTIVAFQTEVSFPLHTHTH